MIAITNSSELSVPALPGEITIKTPSQKQLTASEARLTLIEHCRRYESLKTAIEALNEGYAEGSLSDYLTQAMNNAIDERGRKQDAKLSRATLYRWMAQIENAGHCCPEARQKAETSEIDWMPVFLKHYQRPEKPTIFDAWAKANREYSQQNPGKTMPKYETVTKTLKRIPRYQLENGRSTGSALKSMKNFVRRDWAFLDSNDVWVGDGHTFKAKVKHPDHGFAYAPEVTVIMDCRSRFIVGWSFSLSENQLAVTAALGSAMMRYGVPLSYYSDNGSGQTAKTLDEGTYGLFARFQVAHETGIPGNPQGRGIIERLWQHTTIHVAKQLKTYQGKDMDKETHRKITNEINSYRRKGLTPEYVISWDEFIKRMEERFHWYNHNHTHRELKGKVPADVYVENMKAETVRRLSDQEIITLYRPSVERMPARGEVRLYNNIYYSKALLDVADNVKVQVTYDVMDAEKVWVCDLEGRFICEAIWDGNRVDAFPKAVIQQLKEVRVQTIEKRAQEKIDMARMELTGILEGEAKPIFEIPKAEPVPEKKEFTFEPKAPEPEKKVFDINEKQNKARKLSHEETCLLLYGKQDEGESPKNKAAGL